MSGAPQEIALGDISFVTDGADVRYVRWRGVEVVRRIYITIRDEDWDTPPSSLIDLAAAEEEGAYRHTVSALSKSASVGVKWEASFTGRGSGSLDYEARFTALDAFRYARMGICLLLPPAQLAEREYEAGIDGAMHSSGMFDPCVAPQIIDGGEILPLFPAFNWLRVALGGGDHLEISFGGDLFEMEDQRNWGDGSYKVYCTPLRVPRPHQAKAGDELRQSLTVQLAGEAEKVSKRRVPGRVTLAIGEATGTRVPSIGTLLRDAVSPAVEQTLRVSGLGYLYVEGRDVASLESQLNRAQTLAHRLVVPLAPAVFVSDDDNSIATVATVLNSLTAPLARVTVFDAEAPSETGELAARVKQALAPALCDVPIIGGTDIWFVDLNRNRPSDSLLDGIAWSLTPQVHSEDDLTLFESFEAQEAQVATARAIAPGSQLVVGPITLRPRYNPNARDAKAQMINPPASSIDPRQADSLAAAWTFGSISALSRAGVDAATYFETHGQRGLMSKEGVPYPLWRVLSVACRWSGLPVIDVASDQPLEADALVVSTQEGQRVMVANFTDAERRIRIGAIELGAARQLSMLTPSPRGGAQLVLTSDAAGFCEIRLPPYGVAVTSGAHAGAGQNGHAANQQGARLN